MALVTKLTNGVIGQVATISTAGSTTSGVGYYSIEYEFGSLTGVIRNNIPPTSVPSTISWTIPTSFYNEIPDATSKTGKLISYFTPSVGSKTVNSTSSFTAKIPDSDAPSITYSIATTDSTSSNLTGNTSTIINGVSNVKVTITATPTTGATLVNKGFTYQGNYYSMTLSDTKYLTGGYSGQFNFNAIDSRNRSKQITTTVTAIDYRKPSVAIDDVTISTSGTASISVSGTWFNGSFGSTANTLTVQYRYKSASSSSWNSWSSMSTTKNSDGTYTAYASRSGLSYTQTYDFEARVTDKLNTISSKDYSGKSLPVFDWSDSDFNFNVPVTIDQYYGSNNYVTTKGYVDDLIDAAILGIDANTSNINSLDSRVSTLESSSSSSVTKSDVVDWVYPVGSIYMSVSSTSPATLFGGSWTQLKDRFLLGAGSTYSGGSTGGASTKTLTTANLPSHTHPQYVGLSSGGSTSVNHDYSGWTSTGKTAAQGIATGATGSGTAFNIMPPYLVVYMWKRTA